MDLHGDQQITGLMILVGDSDALTMALARRTTRTTGFTLKARVPMGEAHVGQRP